MSTQCMEWADHYRERGSNQCKHCHEDLGPREDRLPDTLPQEGRKWAGAYLTCLQYGGAEEGGWWYTQSKHLGSAMLRPGDDPMMVARELWKAFADHDDGRDIHNTDADGAVKVYWETAPACHERLGRQTYE